MFLLQRFELLKRFELTSNISIRALPRCLQFRISDIQSGAAGRAAGRWSVLDFDSVRSINPSSFCGPRVETSNVSGCDDMWLPLVFWICFFGLHANLHEITFASWTAFQCQILALNIYAQYIIAAVYSSRGFLTHFRNFSSGWAMKLIFLYF